MPGGGNGRHWVGRLWRVIRDSEIAPPLSRLSLADVDRRTRKNHPPRTPPQPNGPTTLHRNIGWHRPLRGLPLPVAAITFSLRYRPDGPGSPCPIGHSVVGRSPAASMGQTEKTDQCDCNRWSGEMQ